MAKKFIVRIGYVDYAVELADATALLAIAERALPVKQQNYSGPYIVQPDKEIFVDHLALADVFEPVESDKPDVFSTATREVAPF